MPVVSLHLLLVSIRNENKSRALSKVTIVVSRKQNLLLLCVILAVFH